MFDLEDALFLDFVIFEEPVDVLFVDVADGDGDELGVAAIGLGDDLPLEVDERGLEDELRVDALAFQERRVVQLY